eukprot:8666106-Pyramimonas_sp.AAC.1
MAHPLEHSYICYVARSATETTGKKQRQHNTGGAPELKTRQPNVVKQLVPGQRQANATAERRMSNCRQA